MTAADPRERAIVAFKSCGCWAGTVMEHSPSAAEWTLRWVSDGCRVETMAVEDARQIVARCPAHLSAHQTVQGGLL